MKGLPAIWFSLIVLALLAALTLWIDRVVIPPGPKRDGSTRHDPDYIVSNFAIHRTAPDGNLRYVLSGIDMRHYPDNDTTDVVKPIFQEFFADGKPPVNATGERGQISPNGENVYFMDNVNVVRAATPQRGELTLRTEFLHAIPDQGILKTDKPVTILQAPRTVIHATGMELDNKAHILTLKGRVKAHFERSDAAPTRSTAKKPTSTATNNPKQTTQTKTGQTRTRRHYANPAR
jgi:lipopolysaccharide export system protein LptC